MEIHPLQTTTLTDESILTGREDGKPVTIAAAARTSSCRCWIMQRLAALVPRPRLHLIRFHGVLAPHAKSRVAIVPRPKPLASNPSADQAHAHASSTRMSWARLLKRVFSIDMERCPNVQLYSRGEETSCKFDETIKAEEHVWPLRKRKGKNGLFLRWGLLSKAFALSQIDMDVPIRAKPSTATTMTAVAAKPKSSPAI